MPENDKSGAFSKLMMDLKYKTWSPLAAKNVARLFSMETSEVHIGKRIYTYIKIKILTSDAQNFSIWDESKYRSEIKL